MRAPSDAAAALAAILAGDASGWRWWHDRSWEQALAIADDHGVLPLVAEAAGTAGACAGHTRARLAREQRARVAAELVREHELRRLLEALAGGGIDALIVKGADLAYACYASPDLRTRTDSDLLIDEACRDAAADILRTLGYDPAPQSGGDLLMYQQPFRLTRAGVPVHVVDLHWRLFNPQRYGTAFDIRELRARATPRDALSPAARGASTIDALLIACVHRVAHHFDRDRLIWLVDIRQLATHMTTGEWEAMVRQAIDRRIAGVCLRSLEAASTTVAAGIPGWLIDRLRDAAADEPGDRAFLDAAAPHATRVLSDLRLVGGWPARARLLRQHLFPPGVYMRDVYEPRSRLPLPLLYAKRIMRGSRRWLRRA